MIDVKEYQLADPSQLLTPCLLVYPKLIRHNLQESIRIAGGPERLRPHVKTHKTPEIVQMELALGITKHKCATLSEARMLAECGAPDVLIAYPQVGPNIGKLSELVKRFTNTRFSTLVEDQGSTKALDDCFASQGLTIEVLVDIDSGMHRTGILPGEGAIELYVMLSRARALRAAGLHVYDGHNHQPSIVERQQAVTALMEPVLQMIHSLATRGIQIPKLVCGGTPTFPVFSQFKSAELESSIECSPGTCIFSDYNYGKDYADMSGIRHAAVLMTRVISKQHTAQLTLDLGHKAVAADPPAGKRCHFLSAPGAREIKQSEEHLVIQSDQTERFNVGDVLYALPAHICPTVALHSHLHAVEEGQITGHWKVTARDRIY